MQSFRVRMLLAQYYLAKWSKAQPYSVCVNKMRLSSALVPFKVNGAVPYTDNLYCRQITYSLRRFIAHLIIIRSSKCEKNKTGSICNAALILATGLH